MTGILYFPQLLIYIGISQPYKLGLHL
jgi:hypothetical protein